MTLEDIATYLDGQLCGPPDLEIVRPARIEDANEGEITFISNPKYAKFLSKTRASAIIIDDNIKDVELPHVRVKNSYLGFLRVLQLYMPEAHVYLKGISDDAVIDATAVIGEDVHIGPHVYVGPGARVGSGTILYPGVVLLQNVQIGTACVLYPHVSVREECIVGDHVIIHNGSVIGSDGFGFAPDGESYQKIPQLGRVIVEDDVEIGANVTVDRATIGDTVIQTGCKIDNLVQIAHNVTVGKNTVMAAQAGIAGSTQLGEHVTIGGQVGITGHIKVGNQAIIAAQSGVSKEVPDHTVLFGTPALPIMQQKKIDVSMRKLPELIKKIHQLELEVEKLKKNASDVDNSESR